MNQSPFFATPESVAAAKATYEQLLGEVERFEARLAVARRQAAEVIGKAATPEDDIRVTVGAQGQLQSLEIEPRAWRKLSPAQLSEEILELSAEAGRDAEAKIKAILGEAVPEETAATLLGGGAAPWRLPDAAGTGDSAADWLRQLGEGLI